jgi:hypothetical protein
LARLPEKSVFSNIQSSKGDQKKISLEIYLSHLQQSYINDSDLIKFVTTNVVPNRFVHPDRAVKINLFLILIETVLESGAFIQKREKLWWLEEPLFFHKPVRQ